MAPTGFLDRLRRLYLGEPEIPEPVLSVNTAVLLSIFCTLFYVAPLFIAPNARPSATVSRDAPSVIKARVRTVSISTFLCNAGMYLWLVYKADLLPLEPLRLLGWWPFGPLEICKGLLLTALLFLGPLFERGIVDGEWKTWVRCQRMVDSLSGWIGWRNYIAGPATEEVIFRSLIVPLHLIAQLSPTRIVFTTPLYFGIAHVPHLYEFRLAYPDASWTLALIRTFVQFSYTTVFGWFATFLYLRTGSLPTVIAVHAFCNYCGVPRLWGRVGENVVIEDGPIRGKDDLDFPSTSRRLGLGWTVAYYVLLFLGVFAFFAGLWPLTESPYELASFS